MRIQTKDLRAHLKQELLNFYFLFGEEPVQQQESIHLLRIAAKKFGYTEREVVELNASSNIDELIQNFQTPNLFSQKRFIECRVLESKVGKALGEALLILTDTARKNAILFLLIAPKLDLKLQQSEWFKALEQKGCAICIRQLSKEETFTWLERKLIANGFKPTREAISLLFERTEGNLLAAAQAIEKIRLYGAPVELMPTDVLTVVRGESRFSVFDLVDSALLGLTTRTSQIFYSLKAEGIDPTLLTWAAAREIRTVIVLSSKVKGTHIPPHIFNELGVWKRREPLVKALKDRFSIHKLQGVLLKIKSIEDILKGRVIGNAWTELLSVYLTLTGQYCEPYS